MSHDDTIELTAEIVAAYVGNNPVPVGELAKLIESVHASVQNLGSAREATPEKVELKPAVNPKKSVFPDYIVSLEDGKKFKSLKRHLATSYGITPEQYRQKWNLPADYPMTAPSYSAKRAELAKAAGLGRPPAPVKRGRPSKRA
jgi:predicted transcriptional regulator